MYYAYYMHDSSSDDSTLSERTIESLYLKSEKRPSASAVVQTIENLLNSS